MPTPSGTTPQYGFPYLNEGDPPDVATASQDLAQAVENILKTMRIGTMQMWGTATAPTGAVFLQGQAISRTGYPALFALWGTSWGAGDGSTTFNVPDFRGVSPMGAGTGTHTGTTARTLAAFYGAETVTISQSQLPTSIGTHDTDAGGNSANPAVYTLPSGGTTIQPYVGPGTAIQMFWSTGERTGSSTTGITTSASAVTNSGGGSAITNISPTLAVNFIVWAL